MQLSFVLARPTGEPLGEVLDAKSRTLTKRLNGVHDATIVLSLDDPLSGNLAPGLARLKVYRDPTTTELANDPLTTRILVFYGVLPPKSIQDDPATATTTAMFADPRWLFPQRFTLGSEVYTATDQGAIMWGIVDTQNQRFGGAGETWIRQGTVSTGTVRDLVFDRQQLDAEFSAMSQALDGPDYDVIPYDGYEVDAPPSRVMGLLNCYSRQGQVRSSAKFMYMETGGGNVANMPRSYQDIVTYSTVLGQSATGSNVPIAGAWGDPTASLYGLVEDYTTVSNVATQDQLDREAKGEVEALKVPRTTVTIVDPTPEAPQPFVDYDLGDWIYVTCHKGSAAWNDLPVRVHQIDLSVSQEGRLSTVITSSEI